MSDAPKPVDRGVLIAIAMTLVGALVLGVVIAPLLSPDSNADGFSSFVIALAVLAAMAAAAYALKRKY